MIRSALSPAASRGLWLIGCRRASCWPSFTARRKELHLTRRMIAFELTRRNCPTSWSTVRGWERYGHRPSERRCQLLAGILRCSRASLLGMFGLDFSLDPREQQSRRHKSDRRPVAADGGR